jgi:ribose transport system substrate-binding protein/D-allose transport system substrate-binding protein
MKQKNVKILLTLSALFLAACTSGTSSTDSSGDASNASSEVVVGAVSGSAANPAVQVMNAEMERKAKEAGVTLYVETSESVEEQIEKAEALIARGVQYLGLHPWDGAAVVPLIKSAKEKGVKVVILIDGVPDVVENGDALTFISGDEENAGIALGKWTAANKPGAQAGIITGSPGNLAAETRTNAFKQGVSGSDVTVVAEGTGNWAREEALRVAGDMLTANPELSVFFANNDEMGFGALKAVTEANRTSSVSIISWNGTCIGLEALIKGEFVLEAVLPFDAFGAGLIDVAVADSKGESVEPRILPEVPVLTTDDAKAILDGSKSATDALVARLKEAQAGCGA